MTLTSQIPTRLTTDALVVAVAQQDGAPVVLGADWLPAELRADLTRLGQKIQAQKDDRTTPDTRLADAALDLRA